MSTYFNEETGKYENFENAVLAALKDINEALNSGGDEEESSEEE